MILTIALIIMFIGIIGILMPIVPNLPIIWLGAFFYAFFTNFEIVDKNFLILLGIIAVIGFLLDYFSGILGAKKFGATKWGIIGSVIGGIIGFIILNIFGLIIGSFLGALILEYAQGKSFKQALKSGTGTFIGFLGGIIVKIILSFTMIGIFLGKIF